MSELCMPSIKKSVKRWGRKPSCISTHTCLVNGSCAETGRSISTRSTKWKWVQFNAKTSPFNQKAAGVVRFENPGQTLLSFDVRLCNSWVHLVYEDKVLPSMLFIVFLLKGVCCPGASQSAICPFLVNHGTSNTKLNVPWNKICKYIPSKYNL